MESDEMEGNEADMHMWSCAENLLSCTFGTVKTTVVKQQKGERESRKGMAKPFADDKRGKENYG
jgi:hypothetical protein